MNSRDLQRLRFYQQELINAKSRLFKVKSLKEVKVLQDRINFLMSKIQEIQNNGRE